MLATFCMSEILNLKKKKSLLLPKEEDLKMEETGLNSYLR